MERKESAGKKNTNNVGMGFKDGWFLRVFYKKARKGGYAFEIFEFKEKGLTAPQKKLRQLLEESGIRVYVVDKPLGEW